jgi:hypothetical protein
MNGLYFHFFLFSKTNSKCIHIVLLKLSFINLKLCSSSTFLKFKNKDYLLCRIVCGKNSPSHSRCKNKVSCDVKSAYLQSFHHRRPNKQFFKPAKVEDLLNLRENLIVTIPIIKTNMTNSRFIQFFNTYHKISIVGIL